MHIALGCPHGHAHHTRDVRTRPLTLYTQQQRRAMVGSQTSQPRLEVRQHQPVLRSPVGARRARGEEHPVLSVSVSNLNLLQTISPKGVHRGVVRDAKDPGREVAASVERLEPAKRLEKCVLGEFRGHRGVANETRNQAIDRALISIHERGIGALRARQRFADDLVVSHCVCVTMLRLFMYTIC
jgi:hypothetical protein